MTSDIEKLKAEVELQKGTIAELERKLERIRKIREDYKSLLHAKKQYIADQRKDD